MADDTQANSTIPMWYGERGEGDPVVLMHGGLSDSRDFEGNLDALAGRFRLLLPDRRGHGHTADPGPLTVELMARDTIAFLEKQVGGPAHVVGYSAGATVALWVARQRPDLVNRLVLISGAFRPDGLIMRPSADGPLPPQLVAAYAEVSPHGADHLQVVVAKISRDVEEGSALAATDLGGVTARTLVMAGDDDLVTLEHTLELYRGLPDAQLAVVPEATHLLLYEKTELCVKLVTDFLTTDPTPTLMPIRRAT